VDPEEIQLLLDQAKIALKNSEFETAHSLVDKILSQERNDPALNLKAMILFKEKKYKDAIHLFEDLVERYPDDPALTLNLGISYLKGEHYQKAVEQLMKAITLQPENTKIYNYLGLAYNALGEFRKAKEAFIKGGSQKMAEEMVALLEQREGGSQPSPSEITLSEGLSPFSPKEERPDETPEEFPSESAIEQAFTSSLPTSEEKNPTDIVTYALKTLKDRYELFLQSSPSGKRATEIEENLNLLKFWNPPVSLVSPRLLGVRLKQGEEGFFRDSFLFLSPEEGKETVVHRRYKGKELKGLFGGEEEPISRFTGPSDLFFTLPANLQFFLLKTHDDLFYISEDILFGFTGGFRWENGRLPSPVPPDPLITQIRGEGYLVLYYPSDLYLLTYPLENSSVRIRLSSVGGWTGGVIPSITLKKSHEKEEPWVVFQGTGTLFIKVHQ
jgi:tetratricopeptide (TPR) repeat protein